MTQIPLRPMPLPGQEKQYLGRSVGPSEAARIVYAQLVSAAESMDGAATDLERRLAELRVSVAARHRSAKATAADLEELRAARKARRQRGLS